jgi:hypothetical protein
MKPFCCSLSVLGYASAMAYPPAPPDMPLPTVRTALAAHCTVDALCLDCDRVRRLDLTALARRHVDTPLRTLPLRCECGSRNCRVIVSGRAFR